MTNNDSYMLQALHNVLLDLQFVVVEGLEADRQGKH